MVLKPYSALISFLFVFQFVQAQSPPWWLQQPAVDSAELHRTAVADSVLHFAESFIGTPYVWGGCDPNSGFDCSGFICYVYKRFGIDLPRTSAEQFNAGRPVPYTEAKPGDLILFSGIYNEGGNPGHVGIVLSYDEHTGFSFIHTASPESGGVRISNESEEGYYYKRFLEIRRVIN